MAPPAARGPDRPERADPSAPARGAPFFELASSALFLHRPDGTLVDVNPAACETFGYERSAFLRLKPQDYVLPDQVEVFQSFQRTLASGETFRGEVRGRHADGRPLDLLVEGCRIELGGEAYDFSTLLEVTERREAERLLARRARFDRLLATVSLELQTTADLRAGLQAAVERIGQAAGVDFLVFWALEDGRRWVRAGKWYADRARPVVADWPDQMSLDAIPWLSARIRAGRTVTYEASRGFGKGARAEDRIFEALGIQSEAILPVLHEGDLLGAINPGYLFEERSFDDGELERYRVLGRMLASAYQRMLARDALEQRERELARTQEAAGVGSWWRDAARTALHRSPELDRMLGLLPEDAHALDTLLDLVHPEEVDRLRTAMRIVRHSGEARVVEVRMRRRDGQACVLEHRIEADHDADGALTQLHGTVLDITERRATESRLQDALQRLQQLQERIEAENLVLRDQIERARGDELIGDSEVFRTCVSLAERVAVTDARALLLGETGVGKELIARHIHRASGRSGPLIVINCAAIPAGLIESELFGHEQGAFTGAEARKLGRLELAENGTLFLDEIGDLPLELQGRLLRVLQEREFTRVGGTEVLHFGGRVVAATHRDLEDAVAAGDFRQDLYFRLSVFPIRVPPLRERRDDIPALVRHLVAKHARPLGRSIERIDPALFEDFAAQDWPGNVRELESAVQRALIAGQGPVLHPVRAASTPGATLRPQAAAGAPGLRIDAASERLADVEAAHLRAVLRDCAGRIEGSAGAAQRLGLAPSTLRSRMRRLGIRRPDVSDAGGGDATGGASGRPAGDA